MRELANRAPATQSQFPSSTNQGITRGLTVTHGESGRSGTSLGLDDLVTTELDPLDESLVLLSLDILAEGSLREQRNNGDTRVSTDDSDLDILGVLVLDLTEESGRSDNVEGGNTEQPTD